MKKYTFLLAPLLLLAACNKTPPVPTDTLNNSNNSISSIMMNESSSAMMNDSSVMMDSSTNVNKSAYIDQTTDNIPTSILVDGATKVLFFHAAWCPTCKTANTALETLYANTDSNLLPIYKINYDTEVMLKQKYGVVTQHTFVKVDGAGNAINVLQSPTGSELSAFLQS